MKFHRRVSLLLTMGIMAIGLISFKFSPAEATAANKSAVDIPDTVATPTPTAVPTPTPVPSPTPVPNTLTKLDGNTEIDKLIAAYLEAKLSCDMEQFEGIVSDTAYIDEAYLQQRFATIKSFSDITCYSKKGAGNIDYVVYYTYYSEIATITSPAISIDRAFVYKDDDGVLKIYIGTVDDDVEEALNAINYDEDVQQLINDAYAQMEAEAAEDENLLAYWLRAFPNAEFDINSREGTDEDLNSVEDDSEGEG